MKTPVVKKSLNPVWTVPPFDILVPPYELILEMKDKSPFFHESKALGQVDVDLNHLVNTYGRSFEVWLPLGYGGQGEVHIRGVLKERDAVEGEKVSFASSKLSKDDGGSIASLDSQTDKHKRFSLFNTTKTK
jgi:hypothetical protein